MNAATSGSYAAPAAAAASRYECAYLQDFDVAVAVVAANVAVAIDVDVGVDADVTDRLVVVVDVATRPEESAQPSEAAGKWSAEQAAKLISNAMPALTIESNSSQQSSLSATVATVAAAATTAPATTATTAAMRQLVNARNGRTNAQRLLIGPRGLNQINLKSSQSSDQVHGSSNDDRNNGNNDRGSSDNKSQNNSNNRKSPTLSAQLTPTTQTTTTTTTMPVTTAMSSATPATTTVTAIRQSLSTSATCEIADVACDCNKQKGDDGGGVDDGDDGVNDAVVAAAGTDHSNHQPCAAQQQLLLQSTLAIATATTTTSSINTTIDGAERLHESNAQPQSPPTATATPPSQQQQTTAENVAAADSPNADDAPAVKFDLDQRFGCAHYKRRAMFVTPCCNKFYKCRFCHDENETHHFDRKTLTELICSECNTRQAVQERCEHCATRFGKYTCLICNLFDDTDKQQYHCNGCGICRIGGADNFFHCEVCDMCLPIRLKIDGHRCVENISRSLCPVCLGDIHTSRIPCHIPDCGHLLHKTCFDQLLKSGHYACPICQTSLIDMTALWEYLDTQAVSLPIPKKYENQRIHIFCNDCHKTSKTKFNFIGLKCMQCGAYNTTQDVKRRMSLVTADEPSSA